MDKIENEEEEVVNIRHTINAEETFTLAKDVFDIRCFIKNVYANRAVIARRLNVLTLTVSTVFMLLYSAFVLFTGLTNKLNFSTEIVLYSLLGAYAALFCVFIIITLCAARANTKNLAKVKRVTKIFKLFVRLASIAISITAIVLSRSGGALSTHVAVDILIILLSVVTLVFQIIPLLFGGTGKLVRWLLSPVKVKCRFSKVVLEWYELAASGGAREGAVKKVATKHLDDIGALIDNCLVPQLGKKYINSIKPSQILNVTANADADDKPVLEGIFKNVFAYATECGYVSFNPCKDLELEGSVEEEEKPRKRTMKDRLLNVGQRLGKSMLDKYITGATDDKDD